MIDSEFRTYYDQIQKDLPSLIAVAFRQLLESKHLYQKLEVEVKDIMMSASIMSKSTNSHDKLFAIECFKILNWLWQIDKKPTGQSKIHAAQVLSFALPTIKTFCSICNRIEPFNAYPSDSHAIMNHQAADKWQQVFVLEYECQSCKGLPSVFMVRRNGLKLFLEGRSPIEHVEVPQVIPKEQRKYYSDAIVAHNSGQTLAGLFLLRTFIEQYVRAHSENVELPADKLLENYATKLPIDFKDRFPSLGKIYSDLSSAIHKANAAEDLFANTTGELTEHFEAKRLYKIKD